MRSLLGAIGAAFSKEDGAKMIKRQKELIALIDGDAKAAAGSTDMKANRRAAAAALRNLGAGSA